LSTDPTYPLARQGVFLTLQGEGVLLGEPMVFVRLAGCPVACPECDTDYAVSRRATARQIAREVDEVAGGCRWVWLTGGEPTIHDLPPLVEKLRLYGFRVALATAGVRKVAVGFGNTCGPGGVEFLSVSPHRVDETWVQRTGDQLNVVPGLNGLKLSDMEGVDVSGFAHRFVTPFWYAAADRVERVAECSEWVKAHPGWRLGVQAHRTWSLP
jgi:7-carboxy-7-deazaguanine synthase